MTITLTRGPSIPAVPTARRHRRWPWITLIIVGGCLLAAAPTWRNVAVPALVKFPTDVDQNPRYEGTFTLFIDPATAAPLAEPAISTLTVDRHVMGLPAESGSEDVVVEETIAFEVEGLPPATQVHQYVMDRRTNLNVADGRAWAFEESNVLDRSGAAWVAMPRDVDSASIVPMFKDEIGATFTASGTTDTEVVEGLRLIGFSASDIARPATEAYLRSLDAVVPLPRSLTFDQLKPSLLASGLPVDEAIAALVAVATPEDVTALAAMTAEPIPLEYVISFSGQTFVEPQTGAIVDVAAVTDRISARPRSEAVAPLRAILERYRVEPAIAAVIDGLDTIAAEPLPIFEYRYAQTQDSADEVGRWVADQRDRMNLAERTIPYALAIAGGAAVVVGGLLLLRSIVIDRRNP